jgi:hypothetical protein
VGEAVEPSVDVTIEETLLDSNLVDVGLRRAGPQSVFRDPHRATTLTVLTKINLRDLMDDNGHALVRGSALEELLTLAISTQVLHFLEEGRRKVKGHP